MTEPPEIGGSEAPVQEGAPAWMATMADMFSLLLTFFVLLLSFANMDVVKFRMMLGSVRDALGVQTHHPGDIMARATSPVEFSERESTPYLEVMELPTKPGSKGEDEKLLREVEEAIEQLELGRMVEVMGTQKGVVVRVRGQLLFDSGSTSLRPEAYVFLDEIARLSLSFSNALAIEGHTDDLPAVGDRYPTNWDISAARAVSALRYLQEVGGLAPGDLSATGYGDTRPVAPNDSPENRATNRRVEFVYLYDEPDTPPASWR